MKTKIYFSLSTKRLVMLALLIALNIVFTRLFSIQITQISRFSFGNIPIILAGMLLGPVSGIIAGAISDFIGTTLLSPYPWNPLMMITPMLVGFISGSIWKILKNRKITYIWIAIPIISAEIIANMGWSTQCLVWMYEGSFLSYLIARMPVSIISMIIDTLAVWLLYKAKIFEYINKNNY